MPETSILFTGIMAACAVIGLCGAWINRTIKVGRYMQRLDDFIGKQIEINEGRTLQFDAVNGELRKLNDILMQLAINKTEMSQIRKEVDELRHGQGFIRRE